MTHVPETNASFWCKSPLPVKGEYVKHGSDCVAAYDADN